jgi:hypothetical protein
MAVPRTLMPAIVKNGEHDHVYAVLAAAGRSTFRGGIYQNLRSTVNCRNYEDDW